MQDNYGTSFMNMILFCMSINILAHEITFISINAYVVPWRRGET